MGWGKLDKYFAATDQTLVYLAAVVFNPKLKWGYFDVNSDRDWVWYGKQRVKWYWLQYVANQKEESQRNTLIHHQDHDQLGPSSGDGQSSQSDRPQDKEENWFCVWIDRRSSEVQAQDDYERYCSNSEPELSFESSLCYIQSLFFNSNIYKY